MDQAETKVGAPPRKGGSSGPARQAAPKGTATAPTGTATKSAGPKPGHVQEPTSPGETRRSLHLAGKAFARLLGSHAELKPSDFDEMGDSFDQIANKMVPQLRVAIRLIAPLILLGAVVEVGRTILDGTDWYPAWRESRRRRKAEKAQRVAQPQAVAKDPVSATTPTFSTPSAPGPVPAAPEGDNAQPGAVTPPGVPARPLGGMSRRIHLG